MKTTMQLLWGLVHSMQLVMMIVLVNVNVPQSVVTLLSYYRLANGDFNLVEEYVPTPVRTYVLNPDELRTDRTYFRENYKSSYDIDTPFLLLEFEQQMLVSSTLFIALIVILFIFSKLIPKLEIF